MGVRSEIKAITELVEEFIAFSVLHQLFITSHIFSKCIRPLESIRLVQSQIFVQIQQNNTLLVQNWQTQSAYFLSASVSINLLCTSLLSPGAFSQLIKLEDNFDQVFTLRVSLIPFIYVKWLDTAWCKQYKSGINSIIRCLSQCVADRWD